MTKLTSMITFRLALISISMYLHSVLLNACDTRHTNTPLQGLRCVSSVTADMRQIAHSQCVWRCLRIKTCYYINHNSDTGEYELGLGQCESLQSAAGFVVSVFGPPRHGCIRWGSSQEPGSVTVRVGSVDVARIVSGDTVLIGNFDFLSRQFWFNVKGVSFGPIYEADQDIELLIKDATCSLPWMPYIAGEPLPFGAVAGGHLADGTATYVAKVIRNRYAVIGHYNPKSPLAYHEFGGIHTPISMDILVLLWSIHFDQDKTHLNCFTATTEKGSCFNIKKVFPVVGIFIIKMRQPSDRLIFIMWIYILVRRRFYIETVLTYLKLIRSLPEAEVEYTAVIKETWTVPTPVTCVLLWKLFIKSHNLQLTTGIESVLLSRYDTTNFPTRRL